MCMRISYRGNLWIKVLARLWVCKFLSNRVDDNYTCPEVQDQAPKVPWSCSNFRELPVLDPEPVPPPLTGFNAALPAQNLRTCTIIIHTIFRKFANTRLTSPWLPIRYSILNDIRVHTLITNHLFPIQCSKIPPANEQILRKWGNLVKQSLTT